MVRIFEKQEACMATKTFSGRADEQQLALADARTRREFGMSFGQYCGSILVETASRGGGLPCAGNDDGAEKRARAIACMKSIAARPHHAAIGRLTDAEIKELIARRYE